jgi:hypothetical protein
MCADEILMAQCNTGVLADGNGLHTNRQQKNVKKNSQNFKGISKS